MGFCGLSIEPEMVHPIRDTTALYVFNNIPLLEIDQQHSDYSNSLMKYEKYRMGLLR